MIWGSDLFFLEENLCICDIPLIMVPQPRGEALPGGAVVNNPPANAEDARDVGSIPGLGGFPGEGNGNPLQYSCLENSVGRGAWWLQSMG